MDEKQVEVTSGNTPQEMTFSRLKRLKRLRIYSWLVIIFLGISIPFSTLSAILDFGALIKNTTFPAYGDIGALVEIVTGILFCIWIHCAHKNLSSLNVQGLRFSPGWSVAYFFIPVLFWYRPFQVVNEIYKASNSLTDNPEWKMAPTSPLLGL